MGKIIKKTLATEDNDPMGLLGTWGVFTPRRFSPENKDEKKPRKVEASKKKRGLHGKQK